MSQAAAPIFGIFDFFDPRPRPAPPLPSPPHHATAPSVPIPVDQLPLIDSTNVEAMRRIAAGERGPRWIVAAEQTAGRGRSGRSWTSKPGNFYGSLILPVGCKPAVAHQLSLLLGVVVHDAMVEIAGGPIPGLRLKWPNDLLIGGAKLAGLLPESTADRYTHNGQTGGLIVVFGIGINLSAPPAELGRPVASLAEQGIDRTPDEMAAPLSTWMLHWLGLWKAGESFDVVRSAWLERAGPRGEAMQVNAGAGPVVGSFDGLDADGALLLRLESGVVQRFTFGDVTLATATQ